MPQIILELDEDDYILAQYLAEVSGVSVEQAAKDAIIDSVRRIYEARMQSGSRSREERDDKDDELLFEE